MKGDDKKPGQKKTYLCMYVYIVRKEAEETKPAKRLWKKVRLFKKKKYTIGNGI
jgi:hypothetical protein